jgi:hypothetical protein
MSRLKLLIAFLLLTPAAAAQECPRIEVMCPTEMLEQGTPMTFSASVSGGEPNAQFTFNWTVSAGTITSGQGTPSVTLDTTGLGGQIIKATVEVGGLPQSCASTGSCEAKMAPPPIMCRRPFDEYGESRFIDESARLDNFAITLQVEPAAQGMIIVYAGKRARPGEALARAQRAQKYLTDRRGIDAARLLLVDGGYRPEITTELWVVPSGADLPIATPTIDPSEVQIIRDKGRRGRRRKG